MLCKAHQALCSDYEARSQTKIKFRDSLSDSWKIRFISRINRATSENCFFMVEPQKQHEKYKRSCTFNFCKTPLKSKVVCLINSMYNLRFNLLIYAWLYGEQTLGQKRWPTKIKRNKFRWLLSRRSCCERKTVEIVQ